jgi:hypothetical protein
MRADVIAVWCMQTGMYLPSTVTAIAMPLLCFALHPVLHAAELISVSFGPSVVVAVLQQAAPRLWGGPAAAAACQQQRREAASSAAAVVQGGPAGPGEPVCLFETVICWVSSCLKRQ